VALAAEQVDRQRDAWMRGLPGRDEPGDGLDRVADQLLDRDVLVGDAVDEAGVGAVLSSLRTR
jgi:hypothetical protein